MFDYLDKRLHVLYFVIALMLGGCMAFLTPSGAVPDERAHLDKIAAVSAGAMVGVPKTGLVPQISRGLGNVSGKIESHTLMIFSEEIRATFQRPLECSEETAEFHANILGYSPVPYFFSVLNYKSLCAAEASFGAFLYSSRLINLLAAVLLVSIGIRHAGMGRWSLAVVGLMPMTLFLLPSISADSLMIGAAICYIGVLSGAVSRGAILARSELVILVFSGLLLSLTKPGAAWLLALVLVCYPVYQRAQKSYTPVFLMAGLLPLVLHLFFLWNVSGYSAINYPAGADPAVNMKVILENPLDFFAILTNTYSEAPGAWLFGSLLGNLGWLDVPPTSLVVGLIVAALLLSMLLNTRVKQDTWGVGSRIYVLVLAVGSLILLAIPIYVTWSPAGANVVEGLQGRYFIPTAALVLVAGGLYAPRWLQTALAPLTLALVVLGVVGSMYSLHARYYYSMESLADAALSVEWVPALPQDATIPVWLNQGETTSGEFAWKHTARIEGIGVLIGNAYNTADGVLHLQLCNTSQCTDAHRDLAESEDNSYLHFRFERPLVASSSSVLHYEFRLGGGTHPFAFWARAATLPTPGMLLGVAQTPSALSPQFVVKYQKEDM